MAISREQKLLRTSADKIIFGMLCPRLYESGLAPLAHPLSVEIISLICFSLGHQGYQYQSHQGPPRAIRATRAISAIRATRATGETRAITATRANRAIRATGLVWSILNG